MDIDSNHILHMVTVDKPQVGLQSPNMERLTLEHCIDYLMEENITIKEIVTDASTTIHKLMRK